MKYIIIILILLSASPATALSSFEDTGRGVYWVNRYGVVKGEPLKKRIEEIFRKIVLSADRKKGVEPMLQIIDYDGLPWAQALMDGSIILTKNAVRFCYKDNDLEKGDARIAFILGHELSHQLAGDFWHYAFFQALESEEKRKRYNVTNQADTLYKKTLAEIKELVKDSENFLTKEIRADQMGLIYASIAGYRIDLLIQDEKNFFKEFAEAMNIKVSSSHPSTEQRITAAITRLRDVSQRLPIFKVGVTASYLGWNREAIELLEAFKPTYPGKEVYNNLGVAYLKTAIKEYNSYKGKKSFPFKLSITTDPFTGAGDIRVANTGQGNYKKYRIKIEKAIEYLMKAVESGPAYSTAKNNLGAAYLLEGKYHDAIGQFNSALELPASAGAWETLSNRGIAYFLLGKELNTSLDKKSEQDFKAAIKKSQMSTPLFNLSLFYDKTGRKNESKKKFNRYSKTTNRGKRFLAVLDENPLRDILDKKLALKIGTRVLPDHKALKDWQKVFAGRGISLYYHNVKRQSLLIKNSIVHLSVIEGITFSSKALLESFGKPDRSIATARGEVWLYTEGFGFDMTGGSVNTAFVF